MTNITIPALPQGNGSQATIAFSDGVSINAAKALPSIGEAIAAAATKLLEIPDRLANLDRQPSELEAGF